MMIYLHSGDEDEEFCLTYQFDRSEQLLTKTNSKIIKIFKKLGTGSGMVCRDKIELIRLNSVRFNPKVA